MLRKAKSLIVTTAISGVTITASAVMAGQEAKFKDLVGGDYTQVIETLESRGFKNVDSSETPDGYYVVWWYNPKSGQCINTQMKVKDNKLESADAGEHPKCVEAAKQAGGGEKSAQAASSEPSKNAKKACMAKFGGKPKIKTVSALKPGWWEIILQGKSGKQAACTVDDNGTISDWVDM